MGTNEHYYCKGYGARANLLNYHYFIIVYMFDILLLAE